MCYIQKRTKTQAPEFMPRISHQKRYAMSVHEVMRRTGVTWKVAQQVYRDVRSTTTKPLTQTFFRRLTTRRVANIAARAFKAIAVVLFEGEDFGFDLNDDLAPNVRGALTQFPKTIPTIEVTVKLIVFGIPKPDTVTVARTNIPTGDFWSTYYSMVREALEVDYEEGTSVVTTQITAV